MRRTVAILLALSLGLNAGLVVRACRAPSPLERRASGQRPTLDEVLERHFERMTNNLELSAQQQTAIREVHETLLPSVREARMRVEASRDAAGNTFRGAVDAPDVFRASVHEIQQARAHVDSLLTEVLLAEMSVLNADQREEYVKASPWSRRLGGPRSTDDSRRR